MKLEVDFSGIIDNENMHQLLKEMFGFPSFYGCNINALIDCWSSLRFPQSGMTTVVLKDDEVLDLTIKNFPFSNKIMLYNFTVSVTEVNRRYENRKEIPPIRLIFL